MSQYLEGQIINGDALEVLKDLPAHSVDSIVTDPPAAISIMSKKWDSDKGGRDQWIAWLAEIMREACRVIKPGGHALVWALPRTAHWTAMALENAGWDIRDNIVHVFGSGMPKSHNISIAIDKIYGAEREYVGPKIYPDGRSLSDNNAAHHLGWQRLWRDDPGAVKRSRGITVPATPEVEQWNGWGTGLKPATEHWILARAPLAGPTVAANVLRYGTGALNIDACRVAYANEKDAEPRDYTHSKGIGTYQESCKEHGARKYTDGFSYLKNDFVAKTHSKGRWPANFLMSHTLFCTEDECTEDCPVLLLDQQSGMRPSSGRRGGLFNMGSQRKQAYFDQDGSSRYFQQFYYCPKASQAERNFGCDDLPERRGFDKNTSKHIAHINHQTGNTTYTEYVPSTYKNHHPTVKPVNLLQYLIRLITPDGGTVLDMFAGSGSTGVAAVLEGFNFILIEQEAEYSEIAKARIAAVRKDIIR